MSQTNRLTPFDLGKVAAAGGPPSHFLNDVSFFDVIVRTMRPDASAISERDVVSLGQLGQVV
jgi:hypothetical protein